MVGTCERHSNLGFGQAQGAGGWAVGATTTEGSVSVCCFLFLPQFLKAQVKVVLGVGEHGNKVSRQVSGRRT